MDFMEFEHEERTLTCRCESSPATPGTTWWWLNVSGDAQRYAAFRAEPGDNPTNLRRRIVAWHEELLAARARPREFRPQQWSRKPKPDAASEGSTEQG